MAGGDNLVLASVDTTVNSGFLGPITASHHFGPQLRGQAAPSSSFWWLASEQVRLYASTNDGIGVWSTYRFHIRSHCELYDFRYSVDVP